MRRIHCLNNISPLGTALLTEGYALSDTFEGADGALVRSASLHDVELPESLLAIARAGAGVNNIPLERCAEAGIVVFNTPGANANAVKELVICALLLGSRDIAGGIAWCRDNADDENIAKAAEKAKKAFSGREIAGKKLGVIGLGAIGAEVANAAVGLGMDVYGYDPYVSVGAAWRISSAVHHVTNLDDVLRVCDYLTIHVPATDSTKGMIDARACSLMKDGAVFLNFSRDSLVDDEAMAAALSSGKVAVYVTDFANPAVMRMEHAVVLPHLGASDSRGRGQLRGDGRARAHGLPGQRHDRKLRELPRLRPGPRTGGSAPRGRAARKRSERPRPHHQRVRRRGREHREHGEQVARRGGLTRCSTSTQARRDGPTMPLSASPLSRACAGCAW